MYWVDEYLVSPFWMVVLEWQSMALGIRMRWPLCLGSKLPSNVIEHILKKVVVIGVLYTYHMGDSWGLILRRLCNRVLLEVRVSYSDGIHGGCVVFETVRAIKYQWFSTFDSDLTVPLLIITYTSLLLGLLISWLLSSQNLHTLLDYWSCNITSEIQQYIYT